MTAAEFRAAADHLDALAGAATPGPWRQYGMAGVTTPDVEIVYEGPVECGECDWRVALTGCLTNGDAAYIAAMHPGVAKLFAAWLREASQDADLDPNETALAVARHILGAPPP